MTAPDKIWTAPTDGKCHVGFAETWQRQNPMTDTPTPPMTTEQRAATVYALVNLHNIDPDNLAAQLEADGITIATLTAERDAAKDGEKTARNLMQKAFDVNRKVIAERIGLEDALTTAHAEIARLTAALATAREDGMREVKEIKPTQAQIDDACLSYRHDYGLMTPANRALLRFEATEWLLAWGKTVTKGAAT